MYPFLALRALTADVEHAVREIADDEGSLGNASGLDTRAKNVLVVRNIIRCGYSINWIKITMRMVCQQRDGWSRPLTGLLFGWVVQLIFPWPRKALLYSGIFPQNSDRIPDLWRKAVAFNLGRLHEDCLNMILCALIIQGQFKWFHCLKYDAHWLDCIAEDDFFEWFPFVTRITSLMYQLHLLQDCRFSRLSSTYDDVNQKINDISLYSNAYPEEAFLFRFSVASYLSSADFRSPHFAASPPSLLCSFRNPSWTRSNRI